MKADNIEELIVGLKIMRSQIDILIESLCNSNTPKQDRIFLRNITLDLRELYESFYLKKLEEKVNENDNNSSRAIQI